MFNTPKDPATDYPENRRRNKIKDVREDFGNFGAKAVNPPGHNLKRAGDYKKKVPKTTERDEKIRQAYEDMREDDYGIDTHGYGKNPHLPPEVADYSEPGEVQEDGNMVRRKFADPVGFKTKVKAGYERSTIPDTIEESEPIPDEYLPTGYKPLKKSNTELDEIADDYAFDEEHGEYQSHFMKNLRLNQLAGYVPFDVKHHDKDSITNAIKSAKTTYIPHDDLHHIQNLDILHQWTPDWHKLDTDSKLAHVKATTWNYKQEGWEEYYGDDAKEEFNKHFEGLVDHIASGKNTKEESMYPSVLIKTPQDMQFAGGEETWQNTEDAKYYTIGGNTRSMIHQALDLPVPFKIIEPFQDSPSTKEEDIRLDRNRFRAKLLAEKNANNMEKKSMHKLPSLPYSLDSLEPYISEEVMNYHYNKHHQAYVDRLNTLLEDRDNKELVGLPLEDLVLETNKAGTKKIFNQAAQHWNHSFFWNCMSPDGGGNPSEAFMKELSKAFGSYNKFKDLFTKAANERFGSGWTWLVKAPNGAFVVGNSSNASNPMVHGHTPLLVLDVWEHAYYLDYKNERDRYIKAFWNVINWSFVEENNKNFDFVVN